MDGSRNPGHADPEGVPRRARSGRERDDVVGTVGGRISGVTAPLVIALLVAGLHLVDRLVLAEPEGDGPTASPVSPPDPPPETVPQASGRAPAPACVDGGPDGGNGCGILPAIRNGPTGKAYELLTATGERVLVALPPDLSPDGPVVATQDLPIGGIGKPGDRPAYLSTAPPRKAARSCARPCDPTAVARNTLPNGAVVTEWRVAQRAADDRLVTIRMGVWTAVVEEVDPTIAEYIAGVVAWRLEDGFLVVDDSDPTYPLYEDWAGVRIHVPSSAGRFSVTVTPGCDLSGKRPDLRRTDLGPDLRRVDRVPGAEWCAGGRYWVHVRNLDGPELRALHRGLEVHPSEEGDHR